MKKNTLKFIVDSTLFIELTATAAVGLLLRWAFPEGPLYRAERYFMGLHRHQWREFHLMLGILLVLLVAAHLVFNLTWIVQSGKKYFGSRWNLFLLLLCFGWAAVLVIGYVFLII